MKTLRMHFYDEFLAPFPGVLVVDGEEGELAGAAVEPVRPDAEVRLGAARAVRQVVELGVRRHEEEGARVQRHLGSTSDRDRGRELTDCSVVIRRARSSANMVM